MSRSEFTLVIRYTIGDNPKREQRRVPYNWHPSKSEVVDSLRRLRNQIPGVSVASATLVREVLIERYNLGDLP